MLKTMAGFRSILRKSLDTLDVSLSRLGVRGKSREEVSAHYENWQIERARRNLALVDSGTAHLQYGFNEPIHVWHINSFLYTLPGLARLMNSVNPQDFDDGLDLGVGTVSFFDFYNVSNPVLVDISPEYVEFHSRNGKNAVVADVEDLPFEANSFDVIAACDILEHVLSFRTAISEISRVLKPGGYLCVNVPWEQDLKVVKTELGSHLRTFNAKNLRRRFRGFTVVELEIIPKRQKPSRIQTANIILIRNSI